MITVTRNSSCKVLRVSRPGLGAGGGGSVGAISDQGPQAGPLSNPQFLFSKPHYDAVSHGDNG